MQIKQGHIFFLVVFVFFGLNTVAQQKYLPLNHLFDMGVQRQLAKKNNPVHTSLRPYLESDEGMSQANKVLIDSGKYYYPITQKLYKEHLLEIRDSNFYVAVDPLLNLQFSRDIFDDVPFRRTNTRGVVARGDIGKKLSFFTSFYENQLRLPDYAERITQRGIVPGQGRFKRNGGIYDYAFSLAHLSYSPNKNLNFQAGHDKLFVGNGYRSMLLSDNAFSQLFFKTSVHLLDRKIKYSTWISQLQSLERIEVKSTPEAYFKPKAAAFNYLSFKPNNRLELGFFESVMYKTYDDTLGSQPLHFSAYAPLPVVRTLINGLGGKQNAMIGFNVNYKLTNKAQIYGQLALDDVNKTAYQFGMKFFDVFDVENLYFQTEYNKASKGMYAHHENRQSYTHYAQELAHPLGAGFDELVFIGFYQKEKAFIQTKIISAFQKQVGKEFYGANVFLNDLQPLPDEYETQITTLNLQDIQLGYRLNVKTNMYVSAGVINRVYTNLDGLQYDTFLYVGIRTNLNNYYYDF